MAIRKRNDFILSILSFDYLHEPNTDVMKVAIMVQ